MHKGVTTILSFQGGSPIPMDEPHVPMLEKQIAWADEVSYADFAFHAIMQTQEHLDEQQGLAERGVVGFKHFYTAYKPGRDRPPSRSRSATPTTGSSTTASIGSAACAPKEHNVLAMIHAEDADICAVLEERLRAEGRTDLAAWAEATSRRGLPDSQRGRGRDLEGDRLPALHRPHHHGR